MAYYYADSSVLVRRHAQEIGTVWVQMKAYDAVELASALLTNTALQGVALGPLTLLAADRQLLNAAQAEGLAIDNPQLHP